MKVGYYNLVSDIIWQTAAWIFYTKRSNEWRNIESVEGRIWCRCIRPHLYGNRQSLVLTIKAKSFTLGFWNLSLLTCLVLILTGLLYGPIQISHGTVRVRNAQVHMMPHNLVDMCRHMRICRAYVVVRKCPHPCNIHGYCAELYVSAWTTADSCGKSMQLSTLVKRCSISADSSLRNRAVLHAQQYFWMGRYAVLWVLQL